MADQVDHKDTKKRKLDVDRVNSELSQKELQRYILEIAKEPVVFLNRISKWKCLDWTPRTLAKDLSNVRTRFRFCPRVSSPEYRFEPKEVVMETDCQFLEGTFGDFYEWLTCEENSLGLAFGKYPRKGKQTYLRSLQLRLAYLKVRNYYSLVRVGTNLQSGGCVERAFSLHQFIIL